MTIRRSHFSFTRVPFFDKSHIASEIRDSMFLRYSIVLLSVAFLHFFGSDLPFPYPDVMVFSGLLLIVYVTLHLFSTREKASLSVFHSLPYLDGFAAPFIFYFTGGFLSPFALVSVLNAANCTTLHTGIRHFSTQIKVLVGIGYLSIALLQKYGLIDNPVGYSRGLMENSSFFWFIVVLVLLLMCAGISIKEKTERKVQKILEELLLSFETLTKGTTVTVDKDFFSNLARYSAEAFSIRCVVISELSDSRLVQTLAVWRDGSLIPNYTLPLENSIANEITLHPLGRIIEPGVCARYAGDPVMAFFSPSFVYGIRLRDSGGKTIGFFCALHGEKPKTLQLIEPLFTTFALRAAAELERKKTDEKRILVEQQLAIARKMEALAHLAGGLAHDFNNIIGAIGGYAMLLKKKINGPEECTRYIGNILDAGKQASTMINQLSCFVMDDAPRPEPVAIHETMQRTFSLLSQLVSEGTTIRADLSADKLITPGDAALLQNALLNIGLNARDAYEGKEGTITFATEKIELEPGDVLCQSFPIEPGPCIRISISDNGKGMSDEVQSHLFEPFFTTKPKGKGTGLGLSNVWRYVDNYRGAVRVISKPGDGTSFHLYLPIFNPLRRNETISLSSTTASGDASAGPVTVLIADDEPSVREIYGEILRDDGYRVFTCNNGLEALEFIRNGSAAVDIVLLDQAMPVMNGPAAFNAIRECRPDIPVLFMSGHLLHEVITPFLDLPNTSFFRKPCDDADLLRHVRSILVSSGKKNLPPDKT